MSLGWSISYKRENCNMLQKSLVRAVVKNATAKS